MRTLSLDEARRATLAAQGFHRGPLTREVRAADLRRIIKRLSLIQLDFVKVLTPAHYQIFYARLGPFRQELFDELVYGRKREYTEQWAHEACIIHCDTWPLLRHRMEARQLWWRGFEEFESQHPAYRKIVLDEIHRRGPLSADEVDVPEGVDRRLPGSWYGTIPRAYLESLLVRGVLAVVGRRQSMARVFDLAERALGNEIRSRDVHSADADRELIRRAARALGVATAADLTDYWRSRPKAMAPRIAELVESGELLPVQVQSWRAPAYLHCDATIPRKLRCATLLAPFDPVVWYRPRTERLFGFEYRLEIFTPRHKRKYGAYVLPFLLGDRIVARLDMKAERAAGTLRVSGAFLEPGADRDATAEALKHELLRFAGWLGLEKVKVGRRGNLAAALS